MRVMAFLGRYAHQPVDAMLRLPVTLLTELAVETDQLLANERDSMRQSAATGGGG